MDNIKRIWVQQLNHYRHKNQEKKDIVERISLSNCQHRNQADIEVHKYQKRFPKMMELKQGILKYIDRFEDHQQFQVNIKELLHTFFSLYLQKAHLSIQISIYQYLDRHINLESLDKLLHIPRWYYRTTMQDHDYKVIYKTQFYCQRMFPQDIILNMFYQFPKKMQRFHQDII